MSERPKRTSRALEVLKAQNAEREAEREVDGEDIAAVIAALFKRIPGNTPK